MLLDVFAGSPASKVGISDDFKDNRYEAGSMKAGGPVISRVK
jgi:hypothetical protein